MPEIEYYDLTSFIFRHGTYYLVLSAIPLTIASFTVYGLQRSNSLTPKTFWFAMLLPCAIFAMFFDWTKPSAMEGAVIQFAITFAVCSGMLYLAVRKEIRKPAPLPKGWDFDEWKADARPRVPKNLTVKQNNALMVAVQAVIDAHDAKNGRALRKALASVEKLLGPKGAQDRTNGTGEAGRPAKQMSAQEYLDLTSKLPAQATTMGGQRLEHHAKSVLGETARHIKSNLLSDEHRYAIVRAAEDLLNAARSNNLKGMADAKDRLQKIRLGACSEKAFRVVGDAHDTGDGWALRKVQSGGRSITPLPSPRILREGISEATEAPRSKYFKHILLIIAGVILFAFSLSALRLRNV